MQDYIVENLKVGENTLAISSSLEPWGMYKVYAYGKVSDPSGALILSISLESSDLDQLQFAREHPDDAARGVRQFSLDAYRETGLNASGQRTQTHFTFKLMQGQPTYDAIHEEFIKIANGKSHPVSSRTGLIVSQ